MDGRNELQQRRQPQLNAANREDADKQTNYDWMDEPNQEKIEEEIDKEIVPINETIQIENWQLNNNNMQKEYDPQETDAQAIDAMTTTLGAGRKKLDTKVIKLQSTR